MSEGSGMVGVRLADSAARLAPVSAGAAGAYAEQADRMREVVDRSMAAAPDIDRLIGGNPLRVMYDNDRNHADFMTTVLRSGDFRLLAQTLPWVYSAYRSHGFTEAYFPAVLRAWLQAVQEQLAPAHAAEVGAVYRWMLEHHAEIAQAADAAAGGGRAELPGQAEAFLQGLLAGRAFDCQEIAEDLVRRPEDLADFYLGVVQPAMYEVGRLWERDEVSVAEEHLASAIVSRVMASLYRRVLPVEVTKGSIVVTAASNEFHDIGARMAADLLEMDGWDVVFLGANTPDEELVELLRRRSPQLLGISVAMPFNLDRARDTVALVRDDPHLDRMRVLAGGRAFGDRSQSAEWIGADAMARDAREGVRIAAEWWRTDAPVA